MDDVLVELEATGVLPGARPPVEAAPGRRTARCEV